MSGDSVKMFESNSQRCGQQKYTGNEVIKPHVGEVNIHRVNFA